jgi:methionine sulfoxide reductase catalytic subunit
MSHFHFKPSFHLPESLATPEQKFLDRREILASLGLGTLALTLPGLAGAAAKPDERLLTAPALGKRFADRFPAHRNSSYGIGDRKVTAEAKAARYNNFYEFTTTKDEVWKLAQGYNVDAFRLVVRGLVKKARSLSLDEIFTKFPLEERLYRFRCVERWSMQVPWTGFPLRALIDFLEPLSHAKWVRFGSILDRQGLPGQRSQAWYPWPYFEALRLDEARNDLAMVVLGCYGHALPMQHGAPWRIVVPWKYGYKSPKSIVEIEFTEQRPGTFWNDTIPDEYGFFSNVEPQKDHPRWSQRFETDIGTGENRETLLYNGYKEQVGALYTGAEV